MILCTIVLQALLVGTHYIIMAVVSCAMVEEIIVHACCLLCERNCDKGQVIQYTIILPQAVTMMAKHMAVVSKTY